MSKEQNIHQINNHFNTAESESIGNTTEEIWNIIDLEELEKEQSNFMQHNKLYDSSLEKTLPEDYANTYGYGEYLAHLAYELDKNNISSNERIPLKQENERENQDSICIKLQSTHPGLVCYVLVPENLKNVDYLDIKIIFKGTNPKLYKSIIRDLNEPQGAGSISFEQSKEIILQQIADIIDDCIKNKKGIPINITLAGHSLGGADAQNCLAAIMETIAENHGYINNNNNGNKNIPEQIAGKFTKYKIKKLRLFNYNSAGITEETKNLSIDLANFLYQRKKNSPALKKWLPEIETYNYLVDADTVQSTGEAHILDNVPKEYARVDVLKLDNICAINQSSWLMFLRYITVGTSGLALMPTANVLITGAVLFLGAEAAMSTVYKIISSIKGHKGKILLNQSQKEPMHCTSVNNDNEVSQQKVHELLSRKSNLIGFMHQTLLTLMDSIKSNIDPGLNWLGITNKFKYINQDNQKVEQKLTNINDYDNLSLMFVLKEVSHLMDQCEKNSRQKNNSYYGILTNLRNSITSSWSLSDTVWYTCLAFLTVELKNTSNYLEALQLLQLELKDLLTKYGEASSISPKLSIFIEKNVIEEFNLNKTQLIIIENEQSNNIASSSNTPSNPSDIANSIERTSIQPVSFLKKIFDEDESKKQNTDNTVNNAIKLSKNPTKDNT